MCIESILASISFFNHRKFRENYNIESKFFLVDLQKNFWNKLVIANKLSLSDRRGKSMCYSEWLKVSLNTWNKSELFFWQASFLLDDEAKICIKLIIFFDRPWWPSGLNHHVSNSIRDRRLRPRFESPLGITILIAQK